MQPFYIGIRMFLKSVSFKTMHSAVKIVVEAHIQVAISIFATRVFKTNSIHSSSIVQVIIASFFLETTALIDVFHVHDPLDCFKKMHFRIF